jgi:formamidase
MKSIKIDRTKHLCDEPEKGHNRWHPDIPQILEVEAGEEIEIETRDALDGYTSFESTVADFANIPAGILHPLTGPIYVKGATPGDLLEVEFLEITPDNWGLTCIVPGMGFLNDITSMPFLANWKIEGSWATSAQVPGVHIHGAPFMGTAGVAPSHQQLEAWTKREADLLAKGRFVLPPDPTDAVPSSGPVALQGLRTMPPRENGGNLDIKQLTGGAKLFLPVAVEGALFSTGDAHFAMGDGEVCVAAIEMSATCLLRFRLHSGEARQKNIRWPRFQRTDYFTDPKWAVPQRFISTIGMPIDDEGVNQGGNLNLACRNALLNMIDLLQERGFTWEQAYAICSVAVDFKMSVVLDSPNVVVSAFLSEDIFQK